MAPSIAWAHGACPFGEGTLEDLANALLQWQGLKVVRPQVDLANALLQWQGLKVVRPQLTHGTSLLLAKLANISGDLLTCWQPDCLEPGQK